MWQRFTERARRVILLGQEEAGKMNGGHVGTEHLLLGLLREDEGAGAHVLRKMGVEMEAVRARIVAHSTEDEAAAEFKRDWLGRERPASLPEPKLTSKAKRVLELAADEARRLRHNYIGTEHLLLALLREKDGLAARILGELGLELGKARLEVLSYLGVEQEAQRVLPKPRNLERDDVSAQPRSDYASAVMLQWLLAQDSAATRILTDCGLDIGLARQTVSQFLEERER